MTRIVVVVLVVMALGVALAWSIASMGSHEQTRHVTQVTTT